MKYFIYILLCDQKTFYVGITRDLEKRLKEHQNKQSFFTKKFSDIELVYKKEYPDKKSAEIREKQLKGWSYAKKKALITGNIDELVELSKAVNLAKPSAG
ncbi:MAG TPA: GIY-YIG nuclease family protein [Candidatus Wunengus sp. YC60]|uniref:GIY-YIG nuclease family protein n=1 Tax=Candidatus Wunengus sp. YC60 TaxID=3367697 RepID=UPI0040283FE3